MPITVLDTARASEAIYRNEHCENYTLITFFYDSKNRGLIAGADKKDEGSGSAALYQYNYFANTFIISIRGSSTRTTKDWLSDDLTLAAGFTPDRASDCVTFTKNLQDVFPGAVFVVTGHSLGGYLAQVVGVKCNLPFITWNAPPALSTWRGRLADGTRARHFKMGLNFRVKWDPVSRLTAGKHVGPVRTLRHIGANFTNAHMGAAISRSLEHSEYSMQPALKCIAEANL